MKSTRKDELEYGAVVITKGEHAGKIGYYDDDDGRRAIVYFGVPFESDPVLLPRSCLRNVTSLEHEKFKRENPELCSIAGIE